VNAGFCVETAVFLIQDEGSGTVADDGEAASPADLFGGAEGDRRKPSASSSRARCRVPASTACRPPG